MGGEQGRYSIEDGRDGSLVRLVFLAREIDEKWCGVFNASRLMGNRDDGLMKPGRIEVRDQGQFIRVQPYVAVYGIDPDKRDELCHSMLIEHALLRLLVQPLKRLVWCER